MLNPKRIGIEGVKVKVDAKERAKSNEKGEYILDKVIQSLLIPLDESWNLHIRGRERTLHF